MEMLKRKRQPTHDEVVNMVAKQTGKENPTVGDMLKAARRMLKSNYIVHWPDKK